MKLFLSDGSVIDSSPSECLEMWESFPDDVDGIQVDVGSVIVSLPRFREYVSMNESLDSFWGSVDIPAKSSADGYWYQEIPGHNWTAVLILNRIHRGVRDSGIPVDWSETLPVLGRCYYENPVRIAIRCRMPAVHTANVLVHEWAHALCRLYNSARAEIFAESVAYLVSNQLGLPIKWTPAYIQRFRDSVSRSRVILTAQKMLKLI